MHGHKAYLDLLGSLSPIFNPFNVSFPKKINQAWITHSIFQEEEKIPHTGNTLPSQTCVIFGQNDQCG